jgi:hypothetical protein
MPLYLGFPVTCKEAFRLFNLDFEQVKCDIMQKYRLSENMYMDCYFVDYANEFFKGKNLDMRVFYTDKGQCVVGYEIKELSAFQKKYLTSKHLMYSLHHFESHFWYEVDLTGCKKNFNNITLERMEDEPEIVEDADPYIIEF